MSTVMGQVDKAPIRLVILLAHQAIRKNYDHLDKLRKIVNFIGTKFAEIFLSIREDYEFRGFEITYHQCYFEDFKKTTIQIRRDKPDIYLNFFLGKFTNFVSSNKEFSNYFLLPEEFMKALPSDLENEENWSENGRSNMSELLAHLVHEICHSLGGCHANKGIMQRKFDLISDHVSRILDIKLLDIIDKKTVTIICESMSIITTLRPQRKLEYEDGELTYQTDQSIASVFFVKDSTYTDQYTEFTYLDACKFYKTMVPEHWDGFVVVHFCGHIFYYSRKDIETTQQCTKVIEF